MSSYKMDLSTGVIKTHSSINSLLKDSNAFLSPDLKIITLLDKHFNLHVLPSTTKSSVPSVVPNVKRFAWQDDHSFGGKYRIITVTLTNQLCLYEVILLDDSASCNCEIDCIFLWDLYKLDRGSFGQKLEIEDETLVDIMAYSSKELLLVLSKKLAITLFIPVEKEGTPVITSAFSITFDDLPVQDLYSTGDYLFVLNSLGNKIYTYSILTSVLSGEWPLTSHFKHHKTSEKAIKFSVSPDLESLVFYTDNKRLCLLHLKQNVNFQFKEFDGGGDGYSQKNVVTAFVKQFPSSKAAERISGAPSLLRSGSCHCLSVPENFLEMTLKDLFLFGNKVLCSCYDSESMHLVSLDIKSLSNASIRFHLPAVATGMSGSSPLVILQDKSISTVLLDISPEKLVNEIMSYTHGGSAESLSVLNNWQSIQVDYGVLEQGLKNRHLDTVVFFLKMHEERFQQTWSKRGNLEDWIVHLKVEFESWMSIFNVILKTIDDNLNETSSYQFAYHLLQVTFYSLTHLLNVLAYDDSSITNETSEQEQCHKEIENVKIQLSKYLIVVRKKFYKYQSNETIEGSFSKLNEIHEAETSLPAVISEKYNKWKQKQWNKVVQNAILDGDLLLAQSYLASNCKDIASKTNLFHKIRSVGMKYITNYLKFGDLASAIKMIFNMGFSITDTLQDIFRHTNHREIRKLLVAELKKRNKISDVDEKTAQFLSTLETLYPCISFEQSKLLQNNESVSLQTSFPAEVHLHPYGISPDDLKVGDLVPAELGNSETGSYCHLIFDWVSSWTQEVQERIFAPFVLHENSSSLSYRTSPQTTWEHLLEHADVTRLRKWTKFWLGVLPNISREEFPFGWSLNGTMVNSIKGATPAHIEECLLNELGSKGVFCEDELEDIGLLLQRLGHMQHNPASPVSFPSGTMSITMSDFCHRVTHYCLKHNLVNLFYIFLSNTYNRVHPWPKCPVCCTPLLEIVLDFYKWSQKPEDPVLSHGAVMATFQYIYNLPQLSFQELWSLSSSLDPLIATLYSPFSLLQLTSSSHGTNIEASTVKNALASYPVLLDTLFQTGVTSTILQTDFSMYQLLQGNCLFDPSRLFKWQKTNMLKNEESPGDFPHFSLEKLIQKHGLKEEITFVYYLLEGRPHFAYFKFFFQELVGGKTPNINRIQSACEQAKLLALSFYSNQKVTAACVMFIEMLGGDSLYLRTLLSIASMFQDMKPDLDCNELLGQPDIDIAFLLEQSSNNIEAASKVAYLLEVYSLRKQNKFDQIWSLNEKMILWLPAVIFRTMNHLEPSLTYLKECAKVGDWFRFLVYAQIFQVPQEQVLKLLPEFKASYLVNHLHQALQKKRMSVVEPPRKKLSPVRSQRDVRNSLYSKIGVKNVSTTSQESYLRQQKSWSDGLKGSSVSGQSYSIERTIPPESSSDEDILPPENNDVFFCESDLVPILYSNDLLSQLLECHTSETPWRSLLKTSVALCNPILCLFASCYQDASLIECFSIWLSTSLARRKIYVEGEKSSDDSTDLLEELQVLMLEAVKTKNFSLLRKGISMFISNSPLFHLIDFFVSFIEFKEYKASASKLKLFQNNLWINYIEEKNCSVLYTFQWIEAISAQLLTAAIVECSNLYECRLLLRNIFFCRIQNSFTIPVPDFNKLYHLMEHLKDIDVSISTRNLLLPESDPTYIESAWQVVQCLKKQGCYNEASVFIQKTKIPIDNIIINQLKIEIEEYSTLQEWPDISVRLKFWKEADKLMKISNIQPQAAAHYFKSQVEYSVNNTEKYILMKYAVYWLQISDNNTADSLDLFCLWRLLMWMFFVKAEANGEVSNSIETFQELFIVHPNEHILKRPWDISFLFNQDKHNYITQDSSLALETDSEYAVLDSLIGRLLEEGYLAYSYSMIKAFHYESHDFNIIETCGNLARGNISPNQVDNSLLQALPVHSPIVRRQYPEFWTSPSKITSVISISWFTESSQLSLNVHQKKVISVLKQLCEQSKSSSKVCYRILVNYVISLMLQETFDAIACTDDPFKLLKNILLQNCTGCYNVANALLKAYNLTDEDVTKFLCHEISFSLCEYVKDPTLSSNKQELMYIPTNTGENFHQLTRLCADPSLLGSKLLATANVETDKFGSSVAQINLSLVVELYICSHDCFTAACHMGNISRMLHKARVLTQILAAMEEFALLVRLLTGIGRYSEMSYIFDILKDHDQFELLFKKGMEKVPNLRLALLDYLKKSPSENAELYNMLALNFSMFREIAEMWETSALKLLQRIINEGLDNPALKQDLKRAMQEFADAAESYYKADCLCQAQKCAHQAELIALQIYLQTSAVWIIGLQETAVAKFITEHKKFMEARIVAEAYHHHISWSHALYYNMIEQGNWEYLKDFKMYLGLSPTVIEEVAKRLFHSLTKTDVQIKNMKRLLSACTNIETKYHIAKDFGFSDMTIELLKGESGAYLQDLEAKNSYKVCS